MCTKEDVDKFYNFIIKSLENIGKYTENTSKHTEYRKEVLLQYEFMKCSELMIDLKYLEAIERYDKIESEFHDVLSIKNNLTLRFNKGVCFYHSKQFEECRNLFEELYPDYINVYSKTNMSTLKIEQHIVHCYFMLKDFNLAIEHYDNLLPRYRKVYGKNHRETLFLKNNLAASYYEIEEYENAYNIYKTNQLSLERVYGKEDKLSVMSKYFMGISLSKMNSNFKKEVKDIYESVVKPYTKLVGENDISVIYLNRYLADYSYLVDKNYKKALEMYNDILPKYLEYNKRENENEDTLLIREFMACCQIEQGMYLKGYKNLKYVFSNKKDEFQKKELLDGCGKYLEEEYFVKKEEILKEKNLSLKCKKLTQLLKNYKEFISEVDMNLVKNLIRDNLELIKSGI